MSIKVMSLVWDNFPRGGSDKLTMLALADWCNDYGGSLHPSISTIARKINVSESQARRIVHTLIEEGYLAVLSNHAGGNPGQSRHYHMNIPRLSTAPPMDATPSTDATPRMDARLPLAPMRETPSAHDTLSVKNHHITINACASFALFWNAYPKKRSKGIAEKAWSKINPNEQLVDQILRSVERAKTLAGWMKDGGKFIPYPASWLNAKCWEDGYDGDAIKEGEWITNKYGAVVKK